MNEIDKLIFTKLDDIDKRLDNMNVNLAEYNIQLKDHIRRTEILEEAVKPVVSHVETMKSVTKIFAFVSISGGSILTLAKVLDILK